MFALTLLAYAGLYLTRKSFSIAKTGIGEGTEVGLLDSQMAWIDFGYLLAYAIGRAGERAYHVAEIVVNQPRHHCVEIDDANHLAAVGVK